jgi:nucleotide sugar dehydrogenase
MKIGVIGAGRLGICFALLCESAGYDVLVSDIREDYINDLNNRKIITNEPEVENILRTAKNFRATTDNKEVIRECDLIYTLVSTPSLEDGSYDVSYVWDVIEDIKKEVENISTKKYFVVGCTVNPGDCDKFKKHLPSKIKVLYNPEFIAQGSIINDLRTADMVLLGIDHSDQTDLIVSNMRKLYEKIQTTRAIVCTMSTTAAEITKIAINCFLTTKISYANMLGDILHHSGCGDEVTSVLNSIGTDSRIGRKYLKYGFGYGGPCLPRDNRSFAAFAKKVGLEYNLGTVTDEINKQHATFICDYYEKINRDNKPFYFEYITYKKGTDIITESQQYRLCTDLLDRGNIVYILNDKKIIPQVCDYLIDKYGDRVRFVDDIKYIIDPVFIVNL